MWVPNERYDMMDRCVHLQSIEQQSLLMHFDCWLWSAINVFQHNCACINKNKFRWIYLWLHIQAVECCSPHLLHFMVDIHAHTVPPICTHCHRRAAAQCFSIMNMEMSGEGKFSRIGKVAEHKMIVNMHSKNAKNAKTLNLFLHLCEWNLYVLGIFVHKMQ